MKAIVYKEYGSPDVLKLKEVEKPIPKDNKVLIRIYASNVNYGDLTARNFANIPARKFNMPALLLFPAKMAFGMKTPKKQILGSEFSGKIEAIGKDVTHFKEGDEVFAYNGMNMGGNAEYICMPEDVMVGLKPENMSYEEASTIPYGGIMALSLLRKVNIQKGQKVLINGASGGIGSIALQLAKYFGAEVTGVCSTPRIDYVKSLGADHVIDYTKEDFTNNGETYDVFFDILGRSSFSHVKSSLTENGCYLLASFKMRHLLSMIRTKLGGNKKVICAMASENPDDLLILKELAEKGKLKSIIDKSYPLEETAEAHRYVEKGHKKGNVIIKIDHNGKTN
jgi:NADPH:quinone reductase-like Zn-dependent oxidoreductase